VDKVAFVTIHSTDPFADPDEVRSPARRLRGRLASGVTLWTSPGPAGLTVSSTLIADGDPPVLLGLLDRESVLFEALTSTGRVCVTVVGAGDHQLADRFAGRLPAPGGIFATGQWTQTDYGPIPVGASAYAFGEYESATPAGWATLVQVRLVDIKLADAESPLIHYRGRYRRIVD
jgi:flavin reductase (DIM6/NTAB) family NADH-FMN oxidoreductase RutF